MNIYEQYKEIRAIKRNIRNMKARLITDIMRRCKPYMWESGYVGHNGSLKLVVFTDNRYFKPNGISFDFGGFTEQKAIITDALGGGMLTKPLHNIDIQELIIVWSWVERNMDKLKAGKQFYSPAKKW